jgi:hypothetical protein
MEEQFLHIYEVLGSIRDRESQGEREGGGKKECPD